MIQLYSTSSPLGFINNSSSNDDEDDKKRNRAQVFSRKEIYTNNKKSSQLATLYCGLIFHILITDLFNILPANLKHNDDLSINLASTSAWASWIGEIPTAAEVYADASSEMPSAESFDDDDEDEELDASATNEYPDNENDNDNDENYEDAEGKY